MFVVRLTDEDRLELRALIRKAKAAARTVMRARILLKANQGEKGEARTDAEIAEALDVAPKTVFNIRRRWVEESLEAALNRKKQKRPSRARKLDGKAEAKLVATYCGPTPLGTPVGLSGCYLTSWPSWRPSSRLAPKPCVRL